MILDRLDSKLIHGALNVYDLAILPIMVDYLS